MRKRKIRGHRRRWKQIDVWKKKNLDFNDYYFNQYKADYVDIVVHPWCDISISNSEFPELRGKTKAKVLDALFEIYFSWKEKLEKRGEPFYLKIWLYEPRFSKSQVVCAVGDNSTYYDKSFHKSDDKNIINPKSYGLLSQKIEGFKWEAYLDEDHFDNTEVGEPEMYESLKDFEDSKKWFTKLLEKPHRVEKFKEPIGDATESYSFKRGIVWVGDIK